MQNEIKEAKSLNDVIRIVNKHYDLDQPLGVMSKIVVVQGIEKLLKVIGAKKRFR